MKELYLPFSEKQQAQIENYIQTHICDEFRQNSGGFGSTSKLQYLIGFTSIGPVIKLVCPYCGYTEDITDIDTW